ncbi:MAG: hypothetical protein ABGX05_07555, partial [Pirellulaceae bacterium]
MSCHLPTIRSMQKLAPLTLLVIVTIMVSACQPKSEAERNSGNSGYSVTSKGQPADTSQDNEAAKDTTSSSSANPAAVPNQPPALPSAQLDTDKIPEGNT